MKDGKFIITTDIEERDNLLKDGYRMVSDANKEYVFLNNNKLTFSGDKSKITYTNILCV